MTSITLIPPGMLNVKSWGALGDGVTDDAASIQAAINASPVGAILFFPPGTYVIGTMLTLLAKRTYMGTTGLTGGSILYQKDGANLVALAASAEWITNQAFSGYPLRVCNLLFDGNRANNGSGGHGLVIQNYNSIIRECWFQNTAGDGLRLTSVTQNGTSIANSMVECRVESCKVSGTTGYGMYFHDTNGGLTDAWITACVVSGTTQNAIQVDRAAGYFVQGNHCYGCQASGIILNNCWSTFVIGNEIDGFGQNSAATGTLAGITCTLIGPRGTVVSGNIIATSSEPAAGAVYQYLSVTGGGSTDTHATITGNHISGAWTTNPNYPGSTSDSLGLVIQSNSTQVSSGQPYTYLLANNQVQNTGKESYVDSNSTTQTYTAHYFSSVQVDSDVLYKGHLVSQGSGTGPTIANNGGGALGTSPPTPTVAGTDTRGNITFGTGSGTPTAGNAVNVTFNKTFSTTPRIALTPRNAATQALGLYVSSVSTTTLIVGMASAPAASQSTGTYSLDFLAIG